MKTKLRGSSACRYSPSLLSMLVLSMLLPLAATPALGGVGSPGAGDYPVPGDWDGETTTVAFVDLEDLLVHLDCITLPPPPDPIGPVVSIFAIDWDGDGREEIAGFDHPSCSYIEPAEVCAALGGPDPQPWDPDPVSWNVVPGDWNGDGRDTLAIFDLAECTTVPLAQAAVESVVLSEAGAWSFLAGDWDGSGEVTLMMTRSHDCSDGSQLFAGRWDGERDSVAAVMENGTATFWNLDTSLATALESNEATMPDPGEACLDFELQCWTINVGFGGSHQICLRRRCCLGEGCYEYIDNG